MLIVKNTKWNEIVWITKEIENMKMQIIRHQKKIVFSEMKMLKHKIMLKINWLQKHNSRINWKWKKIMMKNYKCKIRQIQMKYWTEVKKMILKQYWKYKKLFMKSSKDQVLSEYKLWNHEILLIEKAASEKLLIYQLLLEKL